MVACVLRLHRGGLGVGDAPAQRRAEGMYEYESKCMEVIHASEGIPPPAGPLPGAFSMSPQAWEGGGALRCDSSEVRPCVAS